MTSVTLDDIRTAHERIRRNVVRTPLARSLGLSELCETDVWLKLECFQATGSFKIRGALNALQQLDGERSVVTASAGNHGLGIARAAALLGVRATVVVAETASQAKIDALRASGAELLLHGEKYDEAEAEALRLARERGIQFVSAYNHPAVIAGGGTVALEIVEDLPEVRTLVVPVGGGGLISGISIAAHGLSPDAAVYGVQSVTSPAVQVAVTQGKVVPVEVQPSLADGLAGNIEPHSITVGLVSKYVHEVALVTEEAIAEAMHWLMVNQRIVVEGAAAVGVAALLSRTLAPVGPIVVVLTGRNVAASLLRQYAHGPLRVPRV